MFLQKNWTSYMLYIYIIFFSFSDGWNCALCLKNHTRSHFQLSLHVWLSSEFLHLFHFFFHITLKVSFMLYLGYTEELQYSRHSVCPASGWFYSFFLVPKQGKEILEALTPKVHRWPEPMCLHPTRLETLILTPHCITCTIQLPPWQL